MKLVIYNCDDIKFIYYVIQFLCSYILQEIDYRKLTKLEKELNVILANYNYNSKYKAYISSRLIINLATNNIEYKKFQDRIEISINDNKKINGTDAKLYDVCKLINYGNISVPGYPIFTEAFNYISDNIEFLYYCYIKG